MCASGPPGAVSKSEHVNLGSGVAPAVRTSGRTVTTIIGSALEKLLPIFIVKVPLLKDATWAS